MPSSGVRSVRGRVGGNSPRDENKPLEEGRAMKWNEIEELCRLAELAEENAMVELEQLGFLAWEPNPPEFEESEDGLERAWREVWEVTL